jgi:predicted glycosyltransferase
MRSEIKDYEQTLIRERAEKKKLRETVDRYKKALEFYADPAVYKLSAEADKADLTEFINMLDMDNGDIARKALKGDEHD